MIMVEGNGTSDTMFERGFQNLFLVATIASDYTRSGIEALAAAGARTAVIAYEDTSFPDSAKELGFEPGGMLITVGPSNPKLIAELGTDADGVLGPTQWEPSMAYAGPYFGRASDYADYYESLGRAARVPGRQRHRRGAGPAPRHRGRGHHRHRHRPGGAEDAGGRHVLRADQLRRAGG